MNRLALALAVIAVAAGLRFGTFAATGADSYGYVSQADLWLQHALIIDQPLGREAPWRYATLSLAPLGYRPGDVRGTMVPIYSPGLPLLMAAFKAIAGDTAKYFVVPLLGGMTVWLTYLLGVRLAGPVAGTLGALALLVSPAFFFQLMWPMSDVPVTAWWLTSIMLALGTGWPSALGAGLACAAAILTRPNLVALALPIAMLIVWRGGRAHDRLRRLLAFGLAAMIGPIVTALVNQHLYGSPFKSGYGTFSTIYHAEYLQTNLAQYAGWMMQTQTPFILLALAAPALAGRRGDGEAKRLATWGLVFSLVVLLSYAWYTPYDNWTYLRFLLPAYPILLAAASAAFTQLFPATHLRAAVVCVALLLTGWGLWQGRDAFQVRTNESRARAAARIAGGLPDGAIIICNQHSGSLRYYAGRITIRYEWLPADAYNDAIAYLTRTGHAVFAVLDEGEREVFRARYRDQADLSWLDREPLVVSAGGVYFYAVPAAPGATP